MNKIKLFALMVFVLGISSLSRAQDQPPPPIQNSAFDMAVGNWSAVPYEMMGTKITSEESSIYLKHGQYLFVEIVGKSSDGNTYTGTVIITADANGNIKGHSYDIWGGDWMLTYTGKAEGNVISLHGANDYMSEDRVITINGDKMSHDVNFSIKMPTGDVNEKLTVEYNKVK
ncbi:MAG: hypothetical protein KDC73_11455 [Ignavibacteriae bacterium]|nr:hypothetical protein [Ignavibacteriota bacterium]MCB9243542.1 hypothetical protein [Ignavibacteriales bacterium]